jgi:predicted transcriptional regulator
MSAADPRRALELTDPRALRAVAHPLRLRLIGLLRQHGPLTATQAARRLGESAQSCWFHLRQLAKYGLVEQSQVGRGRERPWQATAQITSLPRIAPTPQMAAAMELFESVLAESYFEWLMRWIANQQNEPPEWREAAAFGDSLLYLTAAELADLKGQVRTLVDPYVDRNTDHSLRPAGARAVSFLHLAFPQLDGEDASGDGAPGSGGDVDGRRDDGRGDSER